MDRAVFASVLRAARPNFLTLTPLSVLIGIGAALHGGAHIAVSECLLILCGALSAHLSVNLLNEYDDFRSGLDLTTARTPFSGGSGSLPAHPQAAAAARATGFFCLALTALIGLYFVSERGPALLPLGLLGVLLVVAYTPRVTHWPLLCLLAPGLGFGPLMVLGTAFVLTGRYPSVAVVASLPPMFLASELLLVNQFPDVDPDRRVGRRHLPIVLGRRKSALVVAALIVATFAVPPVAVIERVFAPLTLLALLPLPLALLVARQVFVHADDVIGLVRWLGINVVMIHATLLLFALGLLLG
ncbi:MAG TPA: prenyltransferase [Steroidobacteraceae bacterium]|nr:prenyltransferase [Steroidobacteraceae bacterium]